MLLSRSAATPSTIGQRPATVWLEDRERSRPPPRRSSQSQSAPPAPSSSLVLGGSDRPSANVPSTKATNSQAVTPEASAPVLAGPALPPDPRWEVDAVTPDPPPQSSPVVANHESRGRHDRASDCRPNQAARTSRATAASYRGSLAIRSAPQGARVFVNGALVGSTPLVLDNLPVGSRAVRIEADGYEGWSASTRIVANQQTRLSATLARAKP